VERFWGICFLAETAKTFFVFVILYQLPSKNRPQKILKKGVDLANAVPSILNLTPRTPAVNQAWSFGEDPTKPNRYKKERLYEKED